LSYLKSRNLVFSNVFFVICNAPLQWVDAEESDLAHSELNGESPVLAGQVMDEG
jgi:hypothetical protein